MCIFSLRGLCSIFRGEAGGQSERFANNDDEVDYEAVRNYHNNAHWLPDGQASNYVAYYDATSLYPSSGKFFI